MIRMILFRFSITSKKKAPEVVKQFTCPKSRNNFFDKGIKAIRKCPETDIQSAAKELLEDYQLVNVRFQHGKRERCTIFFELCLKEYAKSIHPFFRKKEKEVEKAFLGLCSNSFWSIRSYLNPFFQNRKKIENQFSISINLGERIPKFEENGKPKKVWLKKEEGAKIEKQKIRPLYVLKKSKNSLNIEPFVKKEEFA